MSLVETLKNKHLIAALRVTPLLAVLAWYGVGFIFGSATEAPVEADDKLRVVASTGGTQYYGEVSLTFLWPRS